MAMCQTAKEEVRLTGLLKDFSTDLRTPSIIFGDSQGAQLAFHPRSKHGSDRAQSACQRKAQPGDYLRHCIEFSYIRIRLLVLYP